MVGGQREDTPLEASAWRADTLRLLARSVSYAPYLAAGHSDQALRGTGVRLLALCPGAVKTEIDVFAHNEGLLGKPQTDRRASREGGTAGA